MIYDVAIIGGGVSGAFIARTLMKYKVNVVMLEKEADIATKTSSANSGIVHGGYDAKPNTLKALLNVRGNELIHEIHKELNFEFEETGSLVIGFDADDKKKLQKLYEQGLKNNVKGMRIIEKEEIIDMEPYISKNVDSALLCETAGIVYPFEMTLAAVENACDNGMELKLEFEVDKIIKNNDIFTIYSDNKKVQSRYIVNAAGVFADKIAKLIGDESFSLRPRKGEYMLFDKKMETKVNKVIFQTPSKAGKGVLVTPTTDQNMLIGPNSNYIEDKTDNSTTKEGLKEIKEKSQRSVPNIDFSQVITTFAGLRAVCEKRDFIIEESNKQDGFLNVAGIESPGLSSAPAIGEYAVKKLSKMGLELKVNEKFNPNRREFKRFIKLKDEDKKEIMKENPSYFNIVCRCEKVSEAEIIDSIKRNAGARTLDGVKRRTRARTGRCQGGFCTPLIMNILKKELNIEYKEITKSGKGSNITYGPTKQKWRVNK